MLWASGIAAAAALAVSRVRGWRGPAGALPEAVTEVVAQAAVVVEAPVDRLFPLWAHLEGLPRLLRHLTEVEPLGGDRYLFRVIGAGGAALAWEVAITRHVPGAVVTWRSVPRAPIEHEATVALAPAIGGGVTVSVRLHYRTREMTARRTVRSMMGVQPDRDLGADLQRFKLLVERGRLAA
jgi:uncharacterized membrane protein